MVVTFKTASHGQLGRVLLLGLDSRGSQSAIQHVHVLLSPPSQRRGALLASFPISEGKYSQKPLRERELVSAHGFRRISISLWWEDMLGEQLFPWPHADSKQRTQTRREAAADLRAPGHYSPPPRPQVLHVPQHLK